jgi:hypothetical protein
VCNRYLSESGTILTEYAILRVSSWQPFQELLSKTQVAILKHLKRLKGSADSAKNDSKRSSQVTNYQEIYQSKDGTEFAKTYRKLATSVTQVAKKYEPINVALKELPNYQPLSIQDFIVIPPHSKSPRVVKHRFVEDMQAQKDIQVVTFVRGSLPSVIFVFAIDPAAPDHESNLIRAHLTCKKLMPVVLSNRALSDIKRLARDCLRSTAIDDSIIDDLIREMTGHENLRTRQKEHRQRVLLAIDNGEIFQDLRELSGRPCKYDEFFETLEGILNEKYAVAEERRKDGSAYVADIMSLPLLMTEVKEKMTLI